MLGWLAVGPQSGADRWVTTDDFWDSPSTWSTTAYGYGNASVPGASDVVHVDDVHAVTIDGASAVCRSVAPPIHGTGRIWVLSRFEVKEDMRIGNYPHSTFLNFYPLGDMTVNTLTGDSGGIDMSRGGSLTILGSVVGFLAAGIDWIPGVGSVRFKGVHTPPRHFSSFHHLLIDGGVTTIWEPTTVTGNIVVFSGELNIPGGLITMSQGDLDVRDGATLRVGRTGSGMPAGMSIATFGKTSLMWYAGLAQDVQSRVYGHLRLSTSALVGSTIKTLQAGATVIQGNLTIDSLTTLDAGANDFSVAGNWVNNGVFSQNANQTVTLNGTSTQSIGGSGTTTFKTLAYIGTGQMSLAAGRTFAVTSFKVNGVTQASGTWGGTGSGATHINTTLFAATSGKLSVSTGSDPLHHYLVTASTPQAAGGTFLTTVTAKDVNGLTVTTENSKVVTMTGTTGAQFDGNGDGIFGDGTKTLVGGAFTIATRGTLVGQLTLTATSAGGITGANSPITVAPGPASQLTFTAQPPPSTVAGVAFATQPVVRLQDASGNIVTAGPDSTAVVTLTLTAGTGTLGGTVSMNAVAGVANFAGKGLKVDLAGSNKALTASATVAAGQVTSTTTPAFAILPGAATQVIFATQPSASTVMSTPFAVQPVAMIADAFGNPRTSGTDSGVTVMLSLTSGTGALGGTVSMSAVAGIANFSGKGLNINQLGTDKQLTASASLAAGIRTAVTSPAFAITHGPANQVVFTTQPSASTTAGAAFASQPVVTLNDQWGNVVTSGPDSTATATLTLTTGTGTLSGTVSMSAVAGVANFGGKGLKINSVGTDKALTATAMVAAGPRTATTSPPFAITHGPASQAAFATQPSPSSTAGVMFAVQPVVRIQDAYGNLVTTGADSTRTVSIYLSKGTGTLGGSVSMNAVGGLADFSGRGLNINLIGTDKALTAQVAIPYTYLEFFTLRTGYTYLSATSSPFAVVNGPGSSLVFTRQPSSPTVAGQPLVTQPLVTIKDAYGNVVTTGPDATTSVALNLYSTVGSLRGTAVVNAVAGVADFSGKGLNVTGASTGTYLRAFATLNGVGKIGYTSPFTITHAPSSRLRFRTAPSDSTVAAVPFARQPVVGIEDEFGNLVTSGTDAAAEVLISVSAGTGTLRTMSSLMFSVSDLADASSLATKLKNAADPPSAYLHGRLSAATLSALAAWQAPATPSSALQALLVQDLNVILKGPSIWDPVRFQDVRSNQSGTEEYGIMVGMDLALLHRLLLQDTYPLELGQNMTQAIFDLGSTVSQTAAAGQASFLEDGLGMVSAGTDKVLTAQAHVTRDNPGDPHADAWLTAQCPAFTITHGNLVYVEFTVPPPARTVAGVPFAPEPVVSLLDLHRNVVNSGAESTGDVSLTCNDCDIGPDSTVTLPAVGGVADFSGTGFAVTEAGDRYLVAYFPDPWAPGGYSLFAGVAAFTITPAELSAVQSTVTALPLAATADGVSAATVSVKVRDAFQNPVPGRTVTLRKISGAGTPVINPSSATTDASGAASFQVRSTSAGDLVFSATVNASPTPIALTQTARVTFTAGSPDLVTSSLSASPHEVPADGLASSALGVHVRDAHGNPVPGRAVTLAMTTGLGSPVIAPVSGTTDSNGFLGFTVRSTTAGTDSFAATLVGVGTLTQRQAVTFFAGAVSASGSTVSAPPASVTADGTASSVVTVTLRDAFGNPVAGKSVRLVMQSGPGTAAISSNLSLTSTFGVTSFAVRTTVAGVYVFAATDVSDSRPLNAQATVTFTGGAVSIAKSSVLASPGSVNANGSAFFTVTAILRDAFANPVAGKSVSLIMTSGAGAPVISASSAITDANGGASLQVTSTTAGVANLTAVVANGPNPINLNPIVALTFIGPAGATLSSVSASPPVIVADGVAQSAILVTLRDANGRTVPGASVALSRTSGPGTPVISPGQRTTDANGVTHFLVSSITAGAPVFTATVSGTPPILVNQTATVTFTAGAGNAGKSTVSASPVSVPADGVTSSTIVVSLRDVNSNPVPGKNVTLARTSGLGTPAIAPAQATTDAFGRASFAVRSTIAETTEFTATDSTDSIVVAQRATVTFEAGVVTAAQSTVSASPSSVPDDGSTSSTLTVTLRDAFGNPVSGKAVSLSRITGPGTVSLALIQGTTDASGMARYTVSSTSAGAHVFAATDTTDTVTVTATATVTFVAGAVTAAQSSVSAPAATVIADGASSATVTVTLRDAHGSPVAGRTVSLAKTSGPGSPAIAATQGTTDAAGVATFAVSCTAAGADVFTATDTTDSVVVTQTATVTFIAGAVSAGQSTLSSSRSSVLATGASTATFTLTLKDAFGNPVSGKVVTLAKTSGPGTPTIVTFQGTTDGTGVGAFRASSTTAGTDVFTATDVTDSITITATVTVSFVAGGVTAAQSTVSASPASVTADGETSSTLAVTLRDVFGNPAAGKTVSLAMTSGPGTPAITAVQETTDAAGVALFTVASTSAGAAVFTATDTTDSLVVTQTGTVIFTAGEVSTDLSSLASSPSSVAADGSTTSTVTATLRDAYSNPVEGRTVSLSTTSGPGTPTITPVQATTDAAGVASFAVLSGTVGECVFAATDITDPNVQIPVTQTATVGFTVGGVSAGQSSVSASPGSVTADGVTTSSVTATLRDAGGHPVAGKAVGLGLTSGPGTPVVATVQGTTDALGVALFEVASVTVGPHVFAATDTTDSVHVTQTALVTFTAGPVAGVRSGVSAVPVAVTADGSMTATVTASLKDANGNPVSGKTVVLTRTSGPGSPTITPLQGTTDVFGRVAFQVSSTTAGQDILTATDTTDSVDVPQTATVTFTAGAVDAAQSTVSASRASVMADGVRAATFRVTLRDAFANPVEGRVVTLARTSGPGTPAITTDQGTTDISGIALFRGSSTTIGTDTFTAIDTTDSVTVDQTATVTFTAGPVAGAQSTVVASFPSVPADGLSSCPVVVTLRDAHNNPVAGRIVVLAKASGTGDPTIAAIQATTDAAGVATFAVASLTVGDPVFVATDSADSVVVTQTATVAFTSSASAIVVEQPAGTVLSRGGGRNFGGLVVGAETTLWFTVRNIGSGDLSLTGTPRVAVSGAQATEFSVAAQPDSPVPGSLDAIGLSDAGFETPVLGAGESRFAPAGSAWTFGAQAGLATSGGAIPWFVSPSPEGLQAAIIQSDAAGAFISRTVNFPAAGRYAVRFSIVRRGPGREANDIEVRMDGAALATVPNILQSDDSWRTYSVTYVCLAAGDHTLAFVGTRPGGDWVSAIDDVKILGATTFAVSFSPGAAGPRTATLSVESNDGGGGAFEINVSGMGIAPPSAGADTVHRQPGRTIKIPVAGLLANDTGDAGRSLTVVSVAGVSSGGVPLRLVNGIVFYPAPPGFNSDDSFTYFLSDGSLIATGEVSVVVDPVSDARTKNINGVQVDAGGAVRIAASGIPGRRYQLQMAAALIPPVAWANLGPPQAAPANGQMQFADPTPVTPSFYRVVEATNP